VVHADHFWFAWAARRWRSSLLHDSSLTAGRRGAKLTAMWVFGLMVPVVVVMGAINPLAAVVALALAGLGLLFMKGSVDAAFEGWAGLEFFGAWLGSRRRGRGVTGLEWFCSTCRSLNAPSAEHCYRGCGPRESVERVGAYPVPVEPSAARNQRDRRRG